MALIGEIRKRSGLLVIIVGLALASFVLSDLFSSFFRGSEEKSETVLVNGEPISEEEQALLRFIYEYRNVFTEYQAVQQKRELSDRDYRMTEASAFEEFELIQMIEEQNEYLNIQTPEEELKTLFYEGDSTKLSMIVQNLGFIKAWPNRSEMQTEQWQQMVQFNAARGKKLFEYEDIRERVKAFRLKEKYETLLRSGFYATSFEAKKDQDETNITKNIRFVYMPYDSLPDEDYIPTDEEIKSFYKEHKDDPKYRSTPGKQIEVCEITMQPTDADKKVSLDIIESAVSGFKNTKDDYKFIQRSDNFVSEPKQFDVRAITEIDSGALPEPYNSYVFEQDSLGLFGPYEQNGFYRLAKVKELYPRRARHILFKLDGSGELLNTRGQEGLVELRDSIIEAVEADTSVFDTLARMYSEGPSSTRGGDLGVFTFSRMVPPFSNAVWNTEVGGVSVAVSSHGLHIINVTDELKDSSKFKLAAYYDVNINPQGETVSNYKDTIVGIRDLAMDKGTLSEAAEEIGFGAREFRFNYESYVVPGFQGEERIYQFCKDAIVDEYSQEFVVDGRIMVFHVTKKFKRGPMDQEEAWEMMKEDLMNEKKAEALQIMVAGKQDLNSVAQVWSSSVKSDDVSFSDMRIDGAGNLDKEVVGAVFGNYSDGTVIPDVLQGSGGVYRIQVLSSKVGQPGDISVNQDNLMNEYRNLIQKSRQGAGLGKALSKYEKVKDKR